MGENKGNGMAGTIPNQAAADEVSEDMASPTSKRNTPAFQFYPGDFLSSSKVRRMSMAERGAYITLLATCWLDDGLPTDLKTLATMLHIPVKQFERMWPQVLAECFYEKNGKFHHPRLDKERKKQTDYAKRQSGNAARGWQSRRNATALPPARESHASGNALHLQSSSSSLKNTQTVPRSTLIARRRLDAAWEGGRVWVPQRTHNDFLGYRNGNESELLAWYETVDREYSGQIDPNMFEFWRARYREKWPPTSESRTDSRLPAWAR